MERHKLTGDQAFQVLAGASMQRKLEFRSVAEDSSRPANCPGRRRSVLAGPVRRPAAAGWAGPGRGVPGSWRSGAPGVAVETTAAAPPHASGLLQVELVEVSVT